MLAIIGLARAVAVAVTGYHVVVTEYGVHWNFFLTLAAVKLLASTAFSIIPHRFAWVAGVWNLIAYQVKLLPLTTWGIALRKDLRIEV